METLATKLRKLNDFRRRLPHVSVSALTSVLNAVEAEGVPEHHSRSHFREARDNICAEPTPFGPILQDIDVINKSDERVKLPIAHPFAMLWMAVTLSGAFAMFLQSRLDVHPSSPDEPWRLVLYSDEVTPGNPLSINTRRFQKLYYPFLEFAPAALSKEESWFCLITEFSTFINDLAAGMSQVFAKAVHEFFSQAGDFNIQTGGNSFAIT